MDGSLRIGATVGFLADPAIVRERVEAMEQAGLDSLWLYEPLGGNEAFARAGYLAAITHRARIVVGVVSPYSRHPVVTAAGLSLLAHLSGGRVALLAGKGGAAWIGGMLGIEQERPLRTLGEFLSVLRRLLDGEEVTHAAAAFRLHAVRLDPPAPGPLPLYVTATREAGLRHAAKYADGVFLPIAPPLGYVEWAIEVVRSALPPGKRFEIVADVPLRVTDDRHGACAQLKPVLAYYLGLPRHGRLLLEKAGLPATLSDEIGRASGVAELEASSRDPLGSFRAGGPEAAAELVPDDYVEQCAVIGSVDECRERLRALEATGLDEAVLSFQAAFPENAAALPALLAPR